jgi:hypothetical protein
MTLEVFQLLDKIDHAAETMAAQHIKYRQLASEAYDRLIEFSDQLDLLNRQVRIATDKLGGNWRGAIPAGEPIGAAYPPPTDVRRVQHIIATDGSQIYPDRHGIAHYALVNIGTFHVRPGSGEPPETITFSDLLYGDRLRDDEKAEPLQAADISRERDKQELGTLVALSVATGDLTVALMDSPLLLWILGEPGQRGDLEKWFVDQLRVAQTVGVLLAGYVDRPGSRGVADLLALAPLPEDQIIQENDALQKFEDMPDRTVFRSLLQPGQRSALFTSASPFNPILARHDHNLQIAFFYLNVGAPNDPVIARVETPYWVAKDTLRLGQLHAALWEQCQAPGRYPYALARAHEIALVNMEQRNELENMLGSAMLVRGLQPQTSAKSFLKSLTGG